MEASNIKAMREALLKVKKLFDGRIMFQKAVREAHEVVNAALAAPPRNCDVGTPEEQVEELRECLKEAIRAKCPFTRMICKHGEPCDYVCGTDKWRKALEGAEDESK